MTIKRSISRIVLGGEEPQFIKDAFAHQERIRDDPEVQGRRRSANAEVRHEMLVMAIPALLMTSLVAYYLGPIMADVLDVPTALGVLIIVVPVIMALGMALPRR